MIESTLDAGFTNVLSMMRYFGKEHLRPAGSRPTDRAAPCRSGTLCSSRSTTWGCASACSPGAAPAARASGTRRRALDARARRDPRGGRAGLLGPGSLHVAARSGPGGPPARHPGHVGAKGALPARPVQGSRRAPMGRVRSDRARSGQRCRSHPHHGAPRGRSLRDRWRKDVHHQRRAGVVGDRIRDSRSQRRA